MSSSDTLSRSIAYRILDQPNHKHYGPVRRLHLILLLIYADVGLDSIEERYSDEYLAPWDYDLAWFLDHDEPEARALRTIIGRVLHLD